MKTTTKALLILLTLSTAACTRPDRFGDGADGADGTAGTAGAAVQDLTGANDPTSPQYFAQTVGDRVLFAVDSSTLTPEGQATLAGQAQWLMTNVEYRGVIEGHADEQGTREYNLALGARRANAVQEYLISQGVPSNRLRVVSFGKERPIEICSEESCYAKNRRAVTVVSVEPVS